VGCILAFETLQCKEPIHGEFHAWVLYARVINQSTVYIFITEAEDNKLIIIIIFIDQKIQTKDYHQYRT